MVKDALSLSRIESTPLNEILPATKGVIFLGTPHHGSDIASLGKIAAELSRIFVQNPNVQILRALESNSEVLERISRSFGQVLSFGQLNVHSFQEELETKGVKIVAASSSTIGYLHESRSTLHANHRDMAKFSSHNDNNFRRVSSVISRWVEDIEQSEEVPEPSSTLDVDSDVLPDGLIFDKAYHDCLAGLNSDTHTRIRNVKPAYENTYDWLFDHDVGFGTWLAGQEANPLYWIRGKPGSGKSTIMKYAMTHPRTIHLLTNHNNVPWIIAGFFFHDRGTKAQKSAEGFLGGILQQLLQQCKELFPLIYSAFIQYSRVSTTKEEYSLKSPSYAWSLAQLQQALSLIICKSKVPLNCCLFVDALDEHDGNHRDLISILMEWARASEASTLSNLRLCLAGRPENVFKTAFHRCPGFAIHEYTTSDIRHYAEGRIGKEHFGTLTDDDIKATAPLVEEIVRKANGVFLWVTLVVNELVEGLCEGDALMELEQLLSEIPQELEDLYTRAIRRVPRTSSSALEKHRYEAYVIFQIAMHAQDLLPVPEFMGTVFYSTFGESSVDDARSMSQDKLERRLNSKSAGLLEAVFISDRISDRGSGSECVQFIHQTTKEYIGSSIGQSLLKENLGNKPLENGTVFIVRYLISQITSEKLQISTYAFYMFFPDYARALEVREYVPVGQYLEPVMKSLNNLECLWEPFIPQFRREYSTSHASSRIFDRGERISFPTRRRLILMMFYLSRRLCLSLDKFIANHRDWCMNQDSWYLLFEWVLDFIEDIEPDAIQILIHANLDAEISEVNFRRLMDFADNRRRGTHTIPEVQTLCTQLQERRNKRAIGQTENQNPNESSTH